MQPGVINQIAQRELKTLQRELLAYPDEKDIWVTPPGITNSAGTLVLHLCGNLRHFIGAQLGETGYVRNREAEFADRDVPREQLLALIDKTAAEVAAALTSLSAEKLDEVYPLEVAGFRVRTHDWLLQLIVHLSYHLGQVDYHRRAITEDAKSAGAMAIPELHTAIKV